MAFKDQINQNVGFFIYNREFLFFSGIIGSPQAFNRFQIIPARYRTNHVIRMLSNGKFENLKEFIVFRIVGSIEVLLLSAVIACQNLQVLNFFSRTDTRKDFPKDIIKTIFNKLPELRDLHLRWLLRLKSYFRYQNQIFIKSELEKIVENCKGELNVEIGLGDDWIRITRKM